MSVAAVQLAVAEVPVILLKDGWPGALGGTLSRVVKVFEVDGPVLLAASRARTANV